MDHYSHLELYFGVTGSGAVLHTVNPRLFAEQVRYIISDAAASYVCLDVSFSALVEQLAPHLPSVHGYIALCDRDALPSVDLPNLLCYEELLSAERADYPWPTFDENTASTLCYTSGTTGNPEGVLYTHRAAVLDMLRRLCGDALRFSDHAIRRCSCAHVPCELRGESPFAAAMNRSEACASRPRTRRQDA